MNELMKKKRALDKATAKPSGSASGRSKNVFTSNPVNPEASVQHFLHKTRNAARNYLPQEFRSKPINEGNFEIETRLGVLKVNDRRVTSSGAKVVDGRPAHAFDCTQHKCGMLSGVSKTQFIQIAGGGINEPSAISRALGVKPNQNPKDHIVEKELLETIYTGYSNDSRLCFPGEHPSSQPAMGQMETKDKLLVLDFTIPAAKYDMRMNLSSEKVLDAAVADPPPGWKSKRVKRRRSYFRKDEKIKWQIDVTEVTTTTNGKSTVDYEVEMELFPSAMVKLLNESNEKAVKEQVTHLGGQLWWILSHINPMVDVVDVEEMLEDHPNSRAVDMALAQCGALKKFVDSRGTGRFESPIGSSTAPSALLRNVKFIGCMPINFSRHNLEEIQRSSDNAYYLSEKTDGVRHLMVFVGDTVVLVDRAMRGKRPKPVGKGEPFAPILNLINPGTVFDGEVVMNRYGKKPRAIFIVFDVLSVSIQEAILHLPFDQRLKHLRRASFKTPNCDKDMFDGRFVADPNVALPLVRKNFVTRSGVDRLIGKVVEERGMRCYRDGPLHNHLTDGIIFQPNLPYVCGTDHNLLKWKYLDTYVDVGLVLMRRSLSLFQV